MTADRRSFLASALAPAALADSPLTVGCVGVGNRDTTLLRVRLGLPEARVVAVCDTAPAAVERAAVAAVR
jgi:hypothetical protein